MLRLLPGGGGGGGAGDGVQQQQRAERVPGRVQVRSERVGF